MSQFVPILPCPYLMTMFLSCDLIFYLIIRSSSFNLMILSLSMILSLCPFCSDPVTGILLYSHLQCATFLLFFYFLYTDLALSRPIFIYIIHNYLPVWSMSHHFYFFILNLCNCSHNKVSFF